MNDDMRQQLYLIADQMRGMATLGDHFAENIYEQERAHKIMHLAAQVAALADDEHDTESMTAFFDKRPWSRISPAIGVDALVLNPQAEVLLIRRRDTGLWATPGGIAEIGNTLAETAVIELWEEAGLRGRVLKMLAAFDGRFWKSRSPVHLINMVFQVEADSFKPVAGSEVLDVGFFPQDALPELTPNHAGRLPKVLEILNGDAYFDPTDSTQIELSDLQRP